MDCESTILSLPQEELEALMASYKDFGGLYEDEGATVMFCRPDDATFEALVKGETPEFGDHYWCGPNWYNMCWWSYGLRSSIKMAKVIQSNLTEGALFAYHSGEKAHVYRKVAGHLRRVR